MSRGQSWLDLHIHSALSACAENELAPGLLLRLAAERGLDLVAITDHNAVEHSLMACERFAGRPPEVVPGVELTSREEVHLLAYFPAAGALREFWRATERFLPDRKNRPAAFGYQVLYDERGEIVAVDERLRRQALELGLEQLVRRVQAAGGLAVPAHVDKPAFSLISQLGYVDPSAGFDALEWSRHAWARAGLRLGDAQSGFPAISGSDSHAPDDIGSFRLRDETGAINGFEPLKRFLRAVRERHEEPGRPPAGHS